MKYSGLLLLALLWPWSSSPDRKIEKKMSWIQFTYTYSEAHWCVDAQRKGDPPGQHVGGCWATLKDAEEGILKKTPAATP